jgi:hypothetical protein
LKQKKNKKNAYERQKYFLDEDDEESEETEKEPVEENKNSDLKSK